MPMSSELPAIDLLQPFWVAGRGVRGGAQIPAVIVLNYWNKYT